MSEDGDAREHLDAVTISVTYLEFLAAEGATSIPDRGSYECDQIGVSLCLLSMSIVFSC